MIANSPKPKSHNDPKVPKQIQFLLADAIFSFENACEEGKPPQEAYEAFDILVSAEA